MGGGAGAGEGGGEAAVMVVVVVVEKILEGESALWVNLRDKRGREGENRPLHCYSAETSQVFGVAIGIFTGYFCFVISTDSVVIFLAFFSF